MLQCLIVVIYTYINLTAKYAQRFKMKLSLVVPCYNEEDNVLPFYQTACKDFENSPYTLQFVFVDDGLSLIHI